MKEPPPIPPSAAQRKTSRLAIWSLALGILGVFCFSILGGLPAVFCGHKALARINRSGGRLGGKGLAIGGLVMGYLSLALFPFLAAHLIPNLVDARNAEVTKLCIDNLRQIDRAKETWAIENRKSDSETPTAEDLAPYLKRGFSSLVCPAGGRYSINPMGRKPTCTVKGHQLPSN